MPAENLPAARAIHIPALIREENQIRLLSRLIPGDILHARVLRTNELCVFADIGGSVDAILPAAYIAIVKESCRTSLFPEGMRFLAAVHSIAREERRIYLTHRELLGSFIQLAGGLAPGDPIRGRLLCPGRLLISPNLEARLKNGGEPWLRSGMPVNAKVLSVDPGSCLIHAVAESPGEEFSPGFKYHFSRGRIKHWSYEPEMARAPACSTDFAV